MGGRFFLRLAAPVALLVVASCGRATVPSSGPFTVRYGEALKRCYETKQTPQTLTSTVTFYGWPDNSPPGNQIAHPVIHKVASGDGTWCNPTTFATERKNDKLIPYGIKIYVPYLKQYFIREDDCTTSGPQHLGCKGIWVDLWVGGDRDSRSKAVINCEDSLTKNHNVPIVLWPKANLQVNLPGPIYRDNPPPNGTCYGKPGHG